MYILVLKPCIVTRFALQMKPTWRPANLRHHQQFLLELLQASPNTLVVRTNKKLGPALVDHKTYIHKAFADHLSDRNTYLAFHRSVWLYQASLQDMACKSMSNNGSIVGQFPSSNRPAVFATSPVPEPAHLSAPSYSCFRP
jgi:hypothetical protein